jgi:mono/diheme cytochrome c family protein
VKPVARALLILVAIAAVAVAVLAYTVIRRGLSTQVEPSGAEKAVARAMRYLATPAAVRSRPNPVEPTEAILEEGLEHFADHCALCHANDGSGDTAIGRNLYPPAPDMREAATQNLSDGELFSIIENGIRLTGMPAWGTGTTEGESATWGLVHFIRRLTDLTAEEIARMEGMNPKTPAQFREEEEIRRFLAGEDLPSEGTPTTPSRPHH